jgi:hypothetical protein
MASVLAGFRPVKHLNGSAYNGQVNRYMISASDAQATNVGDFVQLSDNAALVDTVGFGVYPAVERIGSGSAVPIVGVIVGFEPNYDNLNIGGAVYRAASTRRVALVADAPDLIFAGPQDGTGGVVAAASVGLNVEINLGTAGTSGAYVSGMSVDSSTVATTATLPLQIMGVTVSPDNDVTSTARAAEILVRVNTHAFNAAGLAGV